MEAVARENDFYGASLASFEEKRFAADPAWLARIRREAFARFSAMLPLTRLLAALPQPERSTNTATKTRPRIRMPHILAVRHRRRMSPRTQPTPQLILELVAVSTACRVNNSRIN